MRAGEHPLGGDDGGGGAVVRGAGLLNVGDRDQPDLKALLRLLELAGDRLQGRIGCRQGVLGGQHVEIGLRHAQQQVLLRGPVVGLG